MLTERTSHPFTAFRCLASISVLANTGYKRSAGGPGHGSGLRNVKSCFTSGGRCLTMVVKSGHVACLYEKWELLYERWEMLDHVRIYSVSL